MKIKQISKSLVTKIQNGGGHESEEWKIVWIGWGRTQAHEAVKKESLTLGIHVIDCQVMSYRPPIGRPLPHVAHHVFQSEFVLFGIGGRRRR